MSKKQNLNDTTVCSISSNDTILTRDESSYHVKYFKCIIVTLHKFTMFCSS